MIARLCAAAVGVLIALAGAAKVTDYNQWKRDARAQNVWPIVAVVLPPLELLLGALLIVMSPTPEVLGMATLLLLVFTAFLLAQIATKSVIPCACFGSKSKRPPSMRDVARNLAMMALLFVAAVLS
jgi:hypothetical protein